METFWSERETAKTLQVMKGRSSHQNIATSNVDLQKKEGTIKPFLQMRAEGTYCHKVCHIRNAKKSYSKLLSMLTANKRHHTGIHRKALKNEECN